MVALTGIERVTRQFSTVQLSLTDTKHVRFVRREMPKVRYECLACQRGASAVPAHGSLRSSKNPISTYNRGMPIQVDAVYENGVLRPLQPLDLEEQEHVVLSVIKAAPASGRSSLAVEYIEKIKRGLPAAEPGPELDEVRRRLAKIPGSMAAEIVAERGDR